MPDSNLTAHIAAIPLYADLDDREREELAVGMRRTHFAAGESLMNQGMLPDGAYFIVSGHVQVVTKLPGGGETLITELGPGSTIGELALIRSGRRTATVRAVGEVDAIFADRDYFGAALTQLRPAAIKVLRQLARMLSERLRVLHGKIHEAETWDDRVCAPIALPVLADSPQAVTPECFDYAAFLPILPCFRGFDAVGIEAVRRRADVLNVGRSALLCRAGAPPEHCYIVVRGAIASGFIDDGRLHQLNVLGPGRFCALGPLIEDRPTSVCYLVRENAMLLKLARSRFLELYLGNDRTALMLLHAVNDDQAEMVSRANNHLTRLIGLSRLSRQLRGTASAGVSV